MDYVPAHAHTHTVVVVAPTILIYINVYIIHFSCMYVCVYRLSSVMFWIYLLIHRYSHVLTRCDVRRPRLRRALDRVVDHFTYVRLSIHGPVRSNSIFRHIIILVIEEVKDICHLSVPHRTLDNQRQHGFIPLSPVEQQHQIYRYICTS